MSYEAQLGLVNLLPVAASSCCLQLLLPPPVAAYEVHKNRVTNSAKLKPDTVRSRPGLKPGLKPGLEPNERVNSAKINQSRGGSREREDCGDCRTRRLHWSLASNEKSEKTRTNKATN